MAIDAHAIVKTAHEVAKPFAGTLSDAWQAVIGDRIAAWRLANAAKLQVKVNAELAAVGLKTVPAHIPERYAFAWFEEATKQDEDEIQELFARLLARAAAGDEDALDRRLLEIVSRMVPGDAAVLQFLYPDAGKPYEHGQSTQLHQTFDDESLPDYLESHLGDDPVRSLEHLFSLGVLERDVRMDSRAVRRFVQSITSEILGRDGWYPSIELDVDRTVLLTVTGHALVRAIRPAAPRA